MTSIRFRARAGVARLRTAARTHRNPAVAAHRATAGYLLAHTDQLSRHAPVFPTSYPQWYEEDKNNCYGHALGMLESLKPGWLARTRRADAEAEALATSAGAITDPATVARLVELDGLIPLTAAGPDPSWPAGWPVAVLVADGVDFHVIRLDADGRWSAKVGQLAARRLHVRSRRHLMVTTEVSGDGVVLYRLVGFYWAAPARLLSRLALPPAAVPQPPARHKALLSRRP